MEVKRNTIMCLLMTIIVGCYKTEGREPVLHRVGGGRYTWGLEVNFTKWASHEQFYKGDWLYFGFDKHVYSVLEVNKTNFEKCIDKGFITNITRGGRDVFQLLEARPYYFICGRGFCFQGMKFAINVVQQPAVLALSPAMTAMTNHAYPSNAMIHTKLRLLLSITLAWTFV